MTWRRLRFLAIVTPANHPRVVRKNHARMVLGAFDLDIAAFSGSR
jgi:hypothetical protein